ncbi:MAG: pilin glycosylation ligase domain-containing protein, partial [Actinomycetes bacterium]
MSALMGLFQYFDQSQMLGAWVNYAGLGQAFGNLRPRNQFATLCSMGLAMLWWWAQYARVGAQTGAGPITDATSAGALTETPMAPPASADAPKVWASAALTLALVAGAALVCTAAAATSSRTAFMQLLLLLGLAWCWRPSAPTPGGMGRGLGLVGFMLLAYGLAAWLLPLAVGAESSVLDRMRESP